MKKYKLFLISVFPLAVGYAIGVLGRIAFQSSLFPFALVAVVAMICWYFFGRFAYDLEVLKATAVKQAHVFPFVMLCLLLLQKVLIQQYLPVIGVVSQMYFIPFIGLFTNLPTLTISYIAMFLCLVAIFNFGYSKAKQDNTF